MTARQTRVVAAVALGALVVVFWGLRLTRGTAASLGNSDLPMYFLPVYEAGFQRLARGELPLWNPYQLCGIPWLATMQGGFFYPPHLLYFLLPSYRALAASGVLHLLLAAIATALLARRAGLGMPASGLAAVLFVLRGYMPFMLLWPNQLEAVAWLPVGCLGILDVARGGGARPALVLAIAAAASWLCGYPQPTVFVIYAWASLLPALLLGDRAGRARWLAAVGAFAGALVLGTCVAGIQLLPGFELTLAGTRSGQQLNPNTMFPLGGYILGNPGLLVLRHEGIVGSQHSFGILALSLAPAALTGRRQRTLALWALVLGLLSLAFTLGPVTPLWDLLVKLPLLASFRVPSRILFVTDFCLALLAAAGLDAIVTEAEQGPPTRRVARLTALGGLAVTLGLVAAGRWSAGSPVRPALVGAGIALVTLASLWGRRRLGPRPLGAALVALGILEVFSAPPQPLSLPYGPEASTLLRSRQTVYTTLAHMAGPDRVWLMNPFNFVDLGAKLPTLFGLRSLDDYEPMNLRRQAEYFIYLTDGMTRLTRSPWVFAGGLNSAAVRGRRPVVERRRLLDLAAVRFVVMPEHTLAEPDVRAMVSDAGLVPRSRLGSDLVLFENTRAVPRAFVTYRTAAAPDPETLMQRLSQNDFDPQAESYVEGDPGFVTVADAPARGPAATIVRDEERVVEVDADLAAPGLLVLADTFSTGWHATVDGAPASIRATNHLFRGVPVPAGRHRVRFEYRPWTASAGAALTVVGLVAMALLARLT